MPEFSTAIVIPCYNEAESISGVISRILKTVPDAQIVVLDDGSTDQTAQVARAAGAQVLQHPYNKGNGAAIKTALRSLNADRILVIDADGQHPPEMIPVLLEKSNIYDLVVGARLSGEALGHRRFGNWLFCALASFLSDFNIPDLTSGFRVFNRRKALEFIHLYPNGFSFPTTSTLAFISAGYSVTFVPVESALRVKETKSKIRPIRDGMLFLLMILRISTMINPLRIFTPVALVTLLAGVVWTIRTLLMTQQVSAVGAFLFGTGLNILFFGIVVDQLAAIRLRSKD
jgi:glycosyltransferase involved in cell wall biosynthesis